MILCPSILSQALSLPFPTHNSAGKKGGPREVVRYAAGEEGDVHVVGLATTPNGIGIALDEVPLGGKMKVGAHGGI